MMKRNNLLVAIILLYLFGCAGNLSTYTGQDSNILQSFNQAVKFMESNRYHQAIPILQNTVSYNNNANIHLNLAICYRKTGYPNKAIKHFSSAIALNPKLYSAYYNRGIVYHHLGEHKKSKKDLEELSKIDNKDAKLFFIELTFFLKNGFEKNSTKPFGLVRKIS